MSTDKEYNEWIEIRRMDETSAKPRILLIGDSITAGHGTALHERVKEFCCVDYCASSKIVCDDDYWRDLEFVLAAHRYAMIIFNNGLHGITVSDTEYGEGLREVIARLKKFTPLLVWRNCTPCFPVNPNAAAWAERGKVRNGIAEKVVKEAKIPMLDAYTLLKDHGELSKDGLHFLPAGYEVLIQAEAELIEKMLV